MLKEFLEKLQNRLKSELEGYADIDYLREEYGEEFSNIEFVETIGTDEHRWYILNDNVYKVKLEGQAYFFGVTEVGCIKDECAGLTDVCHETKLFEVEKIVKETFKRK